MLKLNINHPFANHLYIHAMEASQHPEKAVAAADRLRKLQPGLAHNVHMPTHIDIRVGQWQKAIDWNAKAIDSAVAYHKISGPAAGAADLLRGAQLSHARVRRPDDRPARAGGEADQRDGREPAGGVRRSDSRR